MVVLLEPVAELSSIKHYDVYLSSKPALDRRDQLMEFSGPNAADDEHQVPLPADLAPGEYQIAVGMYYWPTGERLAVYSHSGRQIADARIILEERVKVE